MWTRCQLRPGLAVLKGTSSPDVQPEGVGGAWGLILPWMGSQGVGWWGGGFEGLGPQAPPPPWTLLGHAAACPFFPARGHGELVPLRVSEDQGPHRGKLSCPGCGVVRASGAEGQQLCSSTAGARLCPSMVLAGGAGRAAASCPLGKRTGSHLFPVSE